MADAAVRADGRPERLGNAQHPLAQLHEFLDRGARQVPETVAAVSSVARALA
jgi:hypothetical protein